MSCQESGTPDDAGDLRLGDGACPARYGENLGGRAGLRLHRHGVVRALGDRGVEGEASARAKPRSLPPLFWRTSPVPTRPVTVSPTKCRCESLRSLPPRFISPGVTCCGACGHDVRRRSARSSSAPGRNLLATMPLRCAPRKSQSHPDRLALLVLGKSTKGGAP